MTKREAAIVSAYTGYLIGEFHEMHVYVEELLGRPVFTHEFGSHDFAEDLRKRILPDLKTIEIT